LKKAFPLLDFSCWSTEQISGAMHHLLSRFVMFVHVETDARESVWQHLRDTGWDAWLNPRGTEATRFAVRERTVVVRSESRKSPSKTPVAPIEKILVELCFEARDLQIMGLGRISHHAGEPGRNPPNPDGQAFELRRRAEIAAPAAFWGG
jgi:hypothetical protein